MAEAAIARLADAGIVLLGQTVLLKGVNAETETLAALFRTMAANRIRPLYLHHPDLAPGTSHFRLTIAEGQAIYGALRGRLSGPAIPLMCSICPAGTARCPSVRTICAKGRMASKSEIRKARGTPIPADHSSRKVRAKASVSGRTR